MTNTVVEILLDRSGSMRSCRAETISGVNEYMNTLRMGDTADSTMIGLTQFDAPHGAVTDMNRVFFRPVSEVSDLGMDDFVPRGMTPLYDAVGKLIDNIEHALATYPSDDRPDILVVIMTDGHNTCNHGYQANKVKRRIEGLKEQGWTFVYLGANQDAWSVGNMFGIDRGNSMTYNTGNMDKTFTNLAAASMAYATASTMSKSADPSAAYVTRSFFSDAGLKEEDFKDQNS